MFASLLRECRSRCSSTRLFPACDLLLSRCPTHSDSGSINRGDNDGNVLALSCARASSLAALLIGIGRERAKHAAARPTPRKRRPPRPTEADAGRGNRRHRLAHPPRPAEPGRADRVRRPGRHRQDRPQLDQRRAPAPAQLGRRPQQQVQQFGQPRQSARRRRRRRRRGRDRPALPRLAPRARAGRRHPLRQRRLGSAASRARPTSTPFPKARSSASRCCRTALRRSTARTRSPAWSTSSPRAAEGLRSPRAQLGGYDEGDGFTQNYQLSWGNGGDGPLKSSSAAIM